MHSVLVTPVSLAMPLGLFVHVLLSLRVSGTGVDVDASKGLGDCEDHLLLLGRPISSSYFGCIGGFAHRNEGKSDRRRHQRRGYCKLG